MPLLTLQVNSSGDDSKVLASAPGHGGASTFDEFSTVMPHGFVASVYLGGHVRFTNVTIPPGSPISDARLQLHSNSNSVNTNTKVLISGCAEDNASAPVDVADYNGCPLTTASVTWTLGEWVSGVWYDSPDISSIIQEIVNRPGWESGNSIVLFVDGATGSTTYTDSKSYDQSAGVAPKLAVTWILSTTTLSHTPEKIVGQLLADLGLGVQTKGTTWKIYTGGLPESPDSCLAVRDTEPIRGSRFQVTGGYQERFGLQILVRGSTKDVASNKMNEIVDAVQETIRRDQVTVDSSLYQFDSMGIASGPIPLGNEKPASRRHLYSLNVLTPITQLI